MKRITNFALALLLLMALAPAQLLAQNVIPSLQPRDARSMGMGGFFSSLSTGFDAIYGNPAAYASSTAGFTLADLSVWGYVKPTTENYDGIMAIAGGSASNQAMYDTVNRLIVENGLGGGFSLGLGYVGKGICIGAYGLADASARGSTAMGAIATGAAALNLVVGLGFPIKLGGTELRIGADVRPFYRADSEDGGWLVSEFLGALASGGDVSGILMDQRVEAGFGLALDFGVQFQVDTLTLGFTVRDVVPSFLTVNETVSELLDQLSAGNVADLSSGSASETLYPYMALGLSWRPCLIKGFLEPGFYLELSDRS